jgi:GNAT superfamily N-acetyltransferase
MAADAASVARIQAACYGPALLEAEALYARRFASPAHCSLGVLDDDGSLVAYLAAYWSVRGTVTPLHGDFKMREDADTLYLHDMAVLPARAGRGLAHALLDAAWRVAHARGVYWAALVSVQGTETFWQRQGFKPARPSAELDSYGPSALYMTCKRLPGIRGDLQS